MFDKLIKKDFAEVDYFKIFFLSKMISFKVLP